MPTVNKDTKVAYLMGRREKLVVEEERGQTHLRSEKVQLMNLDLFIFTPHSLYYF